LVLLGLNTLVTSTGTSTERMSSSPVITFWISLLTSSRNNTLRSPAMASSATATPATVPRPPKIDTPPSSTAATATSSIPLALSARALL
jgi:hypothetical protein